MPDPIDDPDVLDAINAAKAARTSPQIDPDVQDAIKAARAARPYDPNVQPGQYPISGPLDTVSQALEGPAQTVAGYVGSAMDTFRRPVASLIAGDRRTPEQGGVGKAALAWQSRPELFGGHPELAPTPEETKHALGIKGFPDKPGFDAAGNVDWGNVASAKVPNELQNFGVQMVTDPAQLFLLGTKFGVSPKFAAETGAARDAFRAGSIGDFHSPAAARAATAGKFSEAVAQGQAGAQFHIPLVGKDLGFVQLVPRGAAKWLRALDPAIEVLTKSRHLFTGPEPSDPAQLLQVKEEGRSLNTTNELKRQFLPKMAERLTKAGVPLEERPMIRDMAEMLDEDVRHIRDESKPMDVPDRMAGDFGRLTADDPAVATSTKEKFDSGPAFNKVRRDEVMAHYGTLPASQQAAIFETAQDMVHLSNAEVKMFRSRGMEPNILNAAELERFPSLLKEHASLTDFINAGKGTPEELAAAQARIAQVKIELPLAAKQYNAVSRYVPLKITDPTKGLVDETVNPNLSKAQAAQAPDKAVRGLKLADIDPNWKDYGEVKAPSHMAQKYRGVGTPSTAGVGADYVPEGPVKRFFTKLGWKEYKAAESVYEADPLRAWERKLSEADPKAMTNFEMEQHYQTRYKQINKRATVQPIRDAAFKGQGMLQLEDLWKQTGRTDTLAEHMDPGVLADVLAGKIRVRDAITQSWTPYGYKEWEAKGFYKPEAAGQPTQPATQAPEPVAQKAPTPISDFADELRSRPKEPVNPFDGVTKPDVNQVQKEGLVQDLAEKTGVQVKFVDSIEGLKDASKTARGVSRAPGKIEIKNSLNTSETFHVLGHELIEDIVRTMPLADRISVLKRLSEKISPEALAKVQQVWGGNLTSFSKGPAAEFLGATDALSATKELLAEAGGKLFTSPEYLSTFAEVVRDPNLLQRVIDRVSQIIDSVRTALGFEKDPAAIDQLTQTARELIESRRKLIAAKAQALKPWEEPSFEQRVKPSWEEPRFAQMSPEDMRTQLYDLDWSKADVDQMAPDVQWRRIQSGKTEPQIRAAEAALNEKIAAMTPAEEAALYDQLDKPGEQRKFEDEHQLFSVGPDDTQGITAKSPPAKRENTTAVPAETIGELKKLGWGSVSDTLSPGAAKTILDARINRRSFVAFSKKLGLERYDTDAYRYLAPLERQLRAFTLDGTITQRWDRARTVVDTIRRNARKEQTLSPQVQRLGEQLLEMDRSDVPINSPDRAQLEAEITKKTGQWANAKRTPGEARISAAGGRKASFGPSLDNPVGEDGRLGQLVDADAASQRLSEAQNRPTTGAARSTQITPAERAAMDRFPRLVGNAEDLDPKGYLDMPRPEAIKRLAYDYFEDDAEKASSFLDGLEKYKHGEQVYSIDPDTFEPPRPSRAEQYIEGVIDDIGENSTYDWLHSHLKSGMSGREGMAARNLAKGIATESDAGHVTSFLSKGARISDMFDHLGWNFELDWHTLAGKHVSFIENWIAKQLADGDSAGVETAQSLKESSDANGRPLRELATELKDHVAKISDLKMNETRGEFSISDKEPPKPGPENFMHAGALDELRTYQRLGNDPTGFTNWLRNNAPAYMQAVKLSKAFKTLWGPGAPGYIALKTMHDLVRGQIGDAFDLKSPGEITGNAAGHWRYADSGGMDVSGLTYDFGKGINPDTGAPYGVLSGADAARILERNRALGSTGEVAAEFQRGGSVTSKGIAGTTGKALTDFAADIPGAGRKIENFVRGQDSNFRSAAVAKFMREGLSEGEAAFKMQKAFFDFTRQGPVTRILSQSGAVPFAAWQSKIIPFMARWALERPGEFMFVQKALTAMGAGKIPPSQLPQYIQSGTNLPVNVWTDRDGHTHFGIVTDEGVIPGDELMTIARAGPLDFFMGKSGDVLRGLYKLHDRAAQEAKDPEKVTSGEMLGTYAKTVLGHPAHVLSTLVDPEKTAGEKVSAVINPAQYNTFDSTKQGVVTTMTARADVKRALHAVADALLKIRNATADQADKMKTMNQVQALEFLKTDPMYIKAQGELQAAQERVVREKAFLSRTQNEVKRVKKMVDMFRRVP